MTTIPGNLQHVRARIATACQRAGRGVEEVTLLAVSKTFGADAVRAAAAAGQRAFGENYIQEGVEKIAALRDLGLTWHCIGTIQSNKTRLVAEHFDWVHTVDRLKIAERLSAQNSLVGAWQRSLTLSQARYQYGSYSYLNVLDAQRSLYTAQQARISLQLADLVNRMTLFKALGGSWAAQEQSTGE